MYFILKCSFYSELRSRFVKKYYWKRPSFFKFVQLLRTNNVKDLSNLGKFIKHGFDLRCNLIWIVCIHVCMWCVWCVMCIYVWVRMYLHVYCVYIFGAPLFIRHKTSYIHMSLFDPIRLIVFWKKRIWIWICTKRNQPWFLTIFANRYT
mgnify:CR=1 FL=1